MIHRVASDHLSLEVSARGRARSWPNRALVGVAVILQIFAVQVFGQEASSDPASEYRVPGYQAPEYQAAAPTFEVHDLRLENGMQFLVVERPEQPLVAAAWAVRAGSGDEDPGSGVSHLIEHLLFRGSREIGTRNWAQEKEWMTQRDELEERLRSLSGDADSEKLSQLKRRIAGVEQSLATVRIEGELARHYAEAGALGVEGQTNKDASLYSALVPAERLELWFWLESDRLLRPVFRGLYRELPVIEAERRQRLEASPFGVALERFDRAFWGDGHSYSWSIDGLEGGLRRLRRTDLHDHFARHYRPCNLVAALVGDVDPEAIQELAERYFGRLAGSPAGCGPEPRDDLELDLSQPPPASADSSLSESGASRVEMSESCECVPQVELRFRTVAFAHPDAAVLDVVAALLNGRTGRLHRGLVEEQGVAFTASSRHSHLRRSGTFSLFAQAKRSSDAVAGTEELERALLAEIERLGSQPISEDELLEARNRIAMDASRQGKSSLGLVLRLLVSETLGGWQTYREGPKASARVTAEDVRRAVREYFSPERASVLRLQPGPASIHPETDSRTRTAGGASRAPEKNRGRDPGEPLLWLRPAIAAAAEGSEVPKRPELLRFTESKFPSPDGRRARHRLSNGIPVYVVEDHTVPIVDVVLALPVGEFLESPDEVGVSSLAASMLRRGGTELWAPSDFDQRADRLAIEINSVGGRYRSGVRLESSTGVLDPALELWSEIVLRPRFDADRVDGAIASLRAAVAARAASSEVDIERAWNRLQHDSEHFLARQLTVAQVDRLDPSTLREFYSRHWKPTGAAIAVSGDVTTEAVLARLEELLGGWQASTQAPQAAADSLGLTRGSGEAALNARARPPGMPGVFHLDAPARGSQLILGHEGAQRTSWDDPEMFSLMVMSEILAGGGAVSRLASRLRFRESLVYQVNASFGIGVVDRGVFEVAASVSPENARRVAQVVVEEMERLKNQPVGALELDLARRALLDGFPLLFDSAEKRAGRFAEDALLGRPHDYWSRYRSALRAVTAQDVLAVARKYLRPQRLRVLWIGPAQKPEAWQFLGLGPVQELEQFLVRSTETLGRQLEERLDLDR